MCNILKHSENVAPRTFQMSKPLEWHDYEHVYAIDFLLGLSIRKHNWKYIPLFSLIAI